MPEDKQINKSVIKALEILDYLCEVNEPVHLKEIASVLDLPESTVHRLLASLLSKNYVRQTDLEYRYSLGWKFLTLTNSIGLIAQLPQLLKFHLRALAKEVNQAVNLSTLAGKNVLYLDSINPTEKFSMYTPPGAVCPAYASSMGKILLATMPNDEIKELFPDTSFKKLTKNTINSNDTLIKCIETTRTQDYAIDNGEYDERVYCVGGPVRDSHGKLLAAISISIFSFDPPADWYYKYLPALLKTCKKISSEL